MSEAIGAVADALRTSMRQGRMPFLEVSSNSMAPLLHQGDQVGLAPVAAQQLRSGDIVTFVENGHFTTHRFWQREGELLRSRGDRSSEFDRPWRDDALVGRVVVCRRAGRSLPLDKGPGRRLNRLLFTLGQWERRLLAWPLPARFIRVAMRGAAILATAVSTRARVAL